MQVASRLWVLWGIIHPVQGPTTSGSLTLMSLPNGGSLQLSLITLLSAWSVTEIIRYGFFAVKVRGMAWCSAVCCGSTWHGHDGMVAS